MQNKAIVKPIVRGSGFFLFILSLGFLFHSFFREIGAIRQMAWSVDDSMATGIAAAVLGIAVGFLAFSWGLLLSGRDGWHNVKHMAVIYAETSVFKYLPGNVFHFVGRNVAVTRKFSLSHVSIGIATAYEIALSLISATLLSSVTLGFIDDRPPVRLAAGLVLILCLAGGLIAFVAKDHIPLPQRVRNWIGRYHPPADRLPAFALNLAGFAGIMVANGLLANTLWPDKFDPLLTGAAYLVAWMAGFVVPGAPGGLGIREATLILLLASPSNQAEITIFAVITRIVSILGDIILYLMGKAIRILFLRPQPANDSAENR